MRGGLMGAPSRSNSPLAASICWASSTMRSSCETSLCAGKLKLAIASTRRNWLTSREFHWRADGSRIGARVESAFDREYRLRKGLLAAGDRYVAPDLT